MQATTNYEQLDVLILVSVTVVSIVLGLVMIFRTLKERTEHPDPHWVPSDPEELTYLGYELDRSSMDRVLPLPDKYEQENT